MAGRSRVSGKGEDSALTSFNKFIQQTFMLGLLRLMHQSFGTSRPGSNPRYTIY